MTGNAAAVIDSFVLDRFVLYCRFMDNFVRVIEPRDSEREVTDANRARRR